MNKQRRKKLDDLVESLAKVRTMLSEHCERLAELRDEEEDYLYSIPENMQSSERYDMAENAVAGLDEANDLISEATDNIEAAEQSIVAAME